MVWEDTTNTTLMNYLTSEPGPENGGLPIFLPYILSVDQNLVTVIDS